MQLDLTKLINKIPDVLKSNDPPSKRERKMNAKKNKPQDYPGLGDVRRFEDFPSEVNEEFLSIYKDSLDAFVIPYIQAGELTVYKAHQFMEAIVEQIFGNENHYGIYSYLKQRNYDNAPERELVRTAERLINSGWRIVKDNNSSRYKLMNSENSVVLDVTGKSDFYEESQLIQFEPRTAHLFLDGPAASKIEALARKIDMSADELNSLDSMDVLLLHTNDPSIKGYVFNYKKLRGVFSKKASYPIETAEMSFSDLHSAGYVLSDEMIMSDSPVSVLTDGKNKYVFSSVTSEMNQEYVLNKDLISVVGHRVKEDIFSEDSSVKCMEVKEITELNRVIALQMPYVTGDITRRSYTDMVDIFRRLDSGVDSGDISKDFYNRVFSSFASVLVTEAVLLGNRWISPSSFVLDPVTGSFYSGYHRDYFTDNIERLENFITFYETLDEPKSPGRFSDFLIGSEGFPFRLDSYYLKSYCKTIINALPQRFFDNLSSASLSISDYPFEFTGVSEYFNTAKKFLLSRTS